MAFEADLWGYRYIFITGQRARLCRANVKQDCGSWCLMVTNTPLVGKCMQMLGTHDCHSSLQHAGLPPAYVTYYRPAPSLQTHVKLKRRWYWLI